MNASPLVTVAMSAYNASGTIDLALRSILAQTYQDWELIVVDDGSTDRTAESILHVKDSRIRFIQEPLGNLGLAARLNQCVHLARGRYVARMDADDVAYPQRLERQVQFLEEHRGIDLLGTGAMIFKGEGEVIGCYPTASSHEAICRRPWWGFPLAHPTWMGKRTWFLSHPYSDEDTRCEDQALLLQSFSYSRFAALEEILLGYRLDNISARKLGRGRLNYCRRLLRRVDDIPSAMISVQGVLVHSLGFGRDVLLDFAGTLNRWSRSSFQVANDRVLKEWQVVWKHIISQETDCSMMSVKS
ncbi:MAG: glycosyltransferase family 2 protein [Nitrospira sp.]|nr:glycosyltransferase family 2 protein [Nitrospira sp.]